MKKILPSILAASALLVLASPKAHAVNTADIDITINQSLSLILSAESLDLGPDTGLTTDYMTITGSTNNRTGFSISFNVNNPYNDLKHENATVTDSIPSVTEDATESTFPQTAWAYTLDQQDQTFHQIPLVSESIFTTEENGESTYNFGVGAKVAADQTAGCYENELIFTIVANPIPPKILYMQDVADWKDELELEQQVQVMDKRDNKIYWVSKLKDGNIWMTQNLDLDLSVAANQTLTPATSNVTTTRTVTPVAWDWDDDSIYYMDGGDNYFANGTTQTAGLSSLPADDTNRHYAQGDYYSWKAATAGVGTTSITNADVNESICPAGWRLPTSNSDSANYSFGNLVKQYGYTGSNQSGTTDATLLASPLFFARGGYVYSGSLYDQGSYGYYWSSRAYSSSYIAYYLLFNSSYVGPSSDYFRYFGFSVRCVAL